jgi:hypothetical protein
VSDHAPPFDVDAALDALLDALDSIRLDGSITLMTGSNGSGKSLIRKELQLPPGKVVVHASMGLRTGQHAHMGGLGPLLRDTPWMATGENTLHAIRTAIRSCGDNFLCLDEIETGLGEELVLGLVKWLNDNLRSSISGSLGCLVITHSRLVVENLEHDAWISLDGYRTPREWLDREVVAIDPEGWSAQQRLLFKAIQALTKGEQG